MKYIFMTSKYAQPLKLIKKAEGNRAVFKLI